MKITTTLSLSFLLGASYLPAAMAQQITGTPGAPSATITLDGKQLRSSPVARGDQGSNVRLRRQIWLWRDKPRQQAISYSLRSHA